ncbi:CHAT domain-containing protein, partial [Dactylosporangium sp. NPDC005572]|uniref:CHAT domain-containing protein n=1 Tax=Dactylosporangium sp. NPDC005572 TaxID=3156889 RepID=UPI0033AFD2DF
QDPRESPRRPHAAAIVTARGTVLPGAAADTARVVPALHAHDWVHFSGHATADLDQPSRSHLVLADGPLSVADLAARRLDGQVAVLAACSSNRTRADLATEAVHIAAAFHLAGFGQVVGTLWPVADRVSVRFADQLYRGVVDGDRLRPERLAGAVRDAVRHLRERWPDRPGAWAPYVHLGR